MIIVFDPGHGGDDPGAVYRNNNSLFRESDINLAIVMNLLKMFPIIDTDKKMVIGATATRTKDVTMSLSRRTDIAAAVSAFAFISVHTNSHHDKNAHGFEVWHKNDDNSYLLASCICKAASILPLSQRGAKLGNFWVLKHSQCPSVLVELGFISNKHDRDLLLSKEFQTVMSDCLFNGIWEYIKKKLNVSDYERLDNC